jgi:MurNAc alpha-1-phosphate uridylyltransferase
MVFWERAIAAGRAYGLPHQGLWFDVGTPKAVKQVEAMLTDG